VSDFVRSETSQGVATITVARPEKLNALNAEVVAGLDAALSDVAARAADATDAPGGPLRCVVITGAGEKAFIAGADIGELSKLTPIEGREHSRKGQALLEKIERLPIPSIAAINGFAYGGGLELAMACTLRVASENAKMGLPETSLGIIPGYGGTQRLARLVGTAKAYELVLTADKGVTAADAERIGLVNRVVPAGEALTAALEMARRIVANGPHACRYALDAIRSGIEMPAAEGLLFEATLFGLCAATADMKEGMTAFLEKRPARFTGK
jgi:enoyl-CoA hydratase